MAYLSTLAVLCLMLGGCASIWERTYEPRAEALTGRISRSDDVTVRKVPWSRLEATLTELSEAQADRDIHWDEWPDADRKAADAVLLRGLQVSEDPSLIEVLGRSSFKSTDRLKPTDGSLERFAAKIGATYAIWSSKVLGKTDKIVQEPVRESGFRPIRYYDRKRGRYGTRYEYDDWTTYVPVVIEADETAWVVYYLRHRQ